MPILDDPMERSAKCAGGCGKWVLVKYAPRDENGNCYCQDCWQKKFVKEMQPDDSEKKEQ